MPSAARTPAHVALGLAGGLLLLAGPTACSGPEPTAQVVGGSGSPREGEDLVAAFSYDVDLENTQTTSCPVLAVSFTDESTGDPETWQWVFSDGSTSTEQDPVVDRALTEATLTVGRGDDTDSVTQDITFPVC